MIFELPSLWAGTDEQLLSYAEARYRLMQNPKLLEVAQVSAKDQLQAATSKYSDAKEESGEEVGLLDYLADSITDIHGSVGVVKIQGTLVNRDSWLNAWYGDVSYNTVSFALQRLADDPEISHMVMAMGSGGGLVAGLEQGATNLAELRKVKPLLSFVDTAAMSACYWLATEGQQIAAHRMSEVGSIGTMLEHRSMHRLLKEVGIDATIFRAGSEKALGHSSEPLSDKAKSMFQEKVAESRGYFVNHVMARRPDAAGFSSEWIEGQSLFAQKGKDVGLVDRIVPFGQFLSELNDQAAQAKPAPAAGSYYGRPARMQSDQETIMAKQIVITSPTQAAALAGGAPIEGMEPEVATPAEVETPATKADEPQAKEDAKVDGKQDLVTFLREENTRLSGEVRTLTAQVEQQKLAAEGHEANRAKFREITSALLLHRQVALGQVPMDTAAMSDANLLQMYETLEPAFKKAFKIGAQSIPTESAAAREDKQPDLVRQAAADGIYPVAKK